MVLQQGKEFWLAPYTLPPFFLPSRPHFYAHMHVCLPPPHIILSEFLLISYIIYILSRAAQRAKIAKVLLVSTGYVERESMKKISAPFFRSLLSFPLSTPFNIFLCFQLKELYAQGVINKETRVWAQVHFLGEIKFL